MKINWTPKPEDRDFKVGDWVTDRNNGWKDFFVEGYLAAYRIVDIIEEDKARLYYLNQIRHLEDLRKIKPSEKRIVRYE